MDSRDPASAPPGASTGPGPSAARAVFAGLAASLVGIGLARFAYTPLLPAMIHARWFSASEVALLGAANLAGYLLGALGGRLLAAHAAPVAVIRAMMLLSSLAFLACAFPLSQSWFFLWRLASGVAGGAIMVLVSGVVLAQVPPARRGRASGAIFLGIGLGVTISATLVPLVLQQGVRSTWLALGGLSLALTAASWAAWPARPPAPAGAPRPAGARPPLPAPVRRLLLQYALMAVGLVPEMLFLVDYVGRGLGLGSGLAAGCWVAYGLGAMGGPLAYGGLADRIGARATIRLAFGVQLLAVLGLMLLRQPAALLAVAVVVGSFPPGVVPLALGRLHETVPDPASRQALWSMATAAFALAQAVGGYGYSALYGASGGHHVALFAVSALALAAGLAIDPRGRDRAGAPPGR